MTDGLNHAYYILTKLHMPLGYPSVHDAAKPHSHPLKVDHGPLEIPPRFETDVCFGPLAPKYRKSRSHRLVHTLQARKVDRGLSARLEATFGSIAAGALTTTARPDDTLLATSDTRPAPFGTDLDHRACRRGCRLYSSASSVRQ